MYRFEHFSVHSIAYTMLFSLCLGVFALGVDRFLSDSVARSEIQQNVIIEENSSDFPLSCSVLQRVTAKSYTLAIRSCS